MSEIKISLPFGKATVGLTSVAANAPVPLPGETVKTAGSLLTAANVPLYPASLTLKFTIVSDAGHNWPIVDDGKPIPPPESPVIVMTLDVGAAVAVGIAVGAAVGAFVGAVVGAAIGAVLGTEVGAAVGAFVPGVVTLLPAQAASPDSAASAAKARSEDTVMKNLLR